MPKGVYLHKKGRLLPLEVRLKISRSNKGKKLSEEHKQKLSEVKKKMYLDGKLISWLKNLPKERHPHYGKHLSEETKQKISKARKTRYQKFGYLNTLETRKKIKEARARQVITEEHKQKISRALKNIIHDGQFKKGQPPWNKSTTGLQIPWNKGKKGLVSWMKGKHHSDETKLKIRQKRSNQIITEAQKQKMSEIMKQKWKDTEYSQKISKALNKKPNNSELYVDAILQLNFPNQWKFVGDGTIWLEGKNPDFINCNGKKLIIEFDGIYWHKDRNDIERNKIYANYGYDTLSLTDSDLDEDAIIKKTNNFIKKWNDEHGF